MQHASELNSNWKGLQCIVDYIIVTFRASNCPMSSVMSRYAGNVTSANILVQPSQWGATSTSLTTIGIALSIAILSAAFLPSCEGIFYKLHDFHFVTAWSFFSNRYDFFQERLKKTGAKMFHFRVLQVRNSRIYSSISLTYL